MTITNSTGRKPFRSLPKEWGEFLLSILYSIFLPLFPIAIEYLISNNITFGSIMITGIMYTLGMATAFGNKVGLCVCTIIATFLAIGYGVSMGVHLVVEVNPDLQDKLTTLTTENSDTVSFFYWSSSIVILFLAIIHSMQRYNIHICNLQAFLDFGDS